MCVYFETILLTIWHNDGILEYLQQSEWPLKNKNVCALPFFRYYFGDGCETTRATWKHLEAAGFSDLQLRHIQAPLLFMIKPHIVGYAVK